MFVFFCFFLLLTQGLGTDDRKVVQILTSRTLEQRLAIRKAFDANFGRDFLKDLKSETSGDYQSLLVALLSPVPELDAFYLREAMKGLGTDDTSLIEILTTKTNAQVRAVKDAYSKSEYYLNMYICVVIVFVCQLFIF